ncbi:MAG TPA: hypothetical protein VFP09_04460, partial [Desertimonas sp.]|nr:hypothetical protein [Desertimonas sp.]
TVWTYYMEVQAKLHDTTGFVTVRLNGVVIAEALNVDTKNAGTKTTFDTLRFSATGGSNSRFDDLYLMTGAGDAFLGEIQVETLVPNGNGAVNQWMGSDGNQTDNYLLIDEIANINTADYVGSSVSGQQDLYQMTNLVAGSGRIVAVAHTATSTKSDTESKPIRLLNRGNGVIKSDPREPTMGTYTNLSWLLTVNPETGAPFTVAEVNALQSGVETV